MTLNSKAPIKDAQQFLKRKLGVDIPYTTAHKAKEAVCAETINAQREQYNLMKGYVQCLLREDPENIVKLRTQQVSSENGMEKRFQSLFIAPGATRYAFQHIRCFVAVDGTGTKTHFVHILLLAVLMDAQDELVILGWEVVPNECEETWDWFLTSLGKAHPGINERGSVVVNEREKGLINSVVKSLSNAHNAFCLLSHCCKRSDLTCNFH